MGAGFSKPRFLSFCAAGVGLAVFLFAKKRGYSKKLIASLPSGSIEIPKGTYDHEMHCTLSWKWTGSHSVDIDTSCVKFKRDGTCLGAVYFAQPKDTINGIMHSPAGDEKFIFNLSNVKSETHFLFFVLTMFSGGFASFKDASDVCIRLVDSSDKQELAVVNVSNDTLAGNALIAGMLFRKGETWCFKGIDESVEIKEHGTHRDLEPKLAKLCALAVGDRSVESQFLENNRLNPATLGDTERACEQSVCIPSSNGRVVESEHIDTDNGLQSSGKVKLDKPQRHDEHSPVGQSGPQRHNEGSPVGQSGPQRHDEGSPVDESGPLVQGEGTHTMQSWCRLASRVRLRAGAFHSSRHCSGNIAEKGFCIFCEKMAPGDLGSGWNGRTQCPLPRSWLET